MNHVELSEYCASIILSSIPCSSDTTYKLHTTLSFFIRLFFFFVSLMFCFNRKPKTERIGEQGET